MPNNPVVFTPQPITTTPQMFIDDEDLMLFKDEVKLKDRIEDAATTVIQGYKRVRQDDQLDNNYFQPNTTYEFMYDHDLETVVIKFPPGVILKFNGGKLDNGYLIGTSTVIDAPIKTIFGKKLNILTKGDWNIDHAYSDWFDCYKNGYYIDPETFDDANATYDWNGNTFSAGTPCGAVYDNDRFILQQLLNLSARHTIISEGIYMVDSEGGTGESLENQLTWFNKKGLVLQIDGVLKMIPNTYSNYDVLLIANCDHVTLCGSGKLVGDLPEHGLDAGEGGMCLQVNSTINFKLEGLTFEQGWGDGVYYSWRRYAGEDKSLQTHHYWNNVKCLYNRRTGFGVEKGDFIYITNSVFNYTGTFKGTPTKSGVDVEPFGSLDTPQRYCKEIHFDNCVASYNAGGGFRMERVVGGSIKNSEANYNFSAVGLHSCYWGTENKVWEAPPIDSDDTDAVLFESNRIIIDGNTFKYNIGCFNSEYSAITGMPTSALIINNYIEGCATVISGGWQDTVVDHNNIFNIGSVFYLYDIIYNFKFTNNHVFGINVDPQTVQVIFRMEELGYGETTAVCRDVLVKDNTFKYGGGKRLHDGGPFTRDAMTDFYPSVQNYMFIYSYYMINHPQNGVARFIDNHFDDELWAIAVGAPNRIAWSSSQAIIQERTITETDIAYGYVKHFLPGDKIHVNGQTGFVRVGGWIDVVGSEFLPNTSYKENQIIYNSERTAMFIALKDFTTTASPVYPSPTDATVGSIFGDMPITQVDFSSPDVQWQNVGACLSDHGSIYLPQLNNVGRRLIETNTGNMIQWDGNAWVIV